MTTPTPLDQQRQIVRSFVTADQRRRQRETTAQQQYAQSEKAALEQASASEQAALQEYMSAVKTHQADLQRQQTQMKQAVSTIVNVQRVARSALQGMLGAFFTELPPALEDVTPQPPTAKTDAVALTKFLASADRINQLKAEVLQVIAAQQTQRTRENQKLIGAVAAVIVLVVIGFFFQRWSYDQRLSGLYQAGVAALNGQDWRVARDRFNELLALEPGYQDARTLLHESYYRAGKAALDAGDWQLAQAQLNELMTMAPGYQDARTLLYDSYYRAGKAAVESGDWQAARDQLAESLRLQPDNADAKALVNQHAEDFGFAFNPADDAVYMLIPAGEFLMGSPDNVGDGDEHPQHTVYLDAFWIMQTEVTNAQYAKCVADGACSAPDNSRWQDAAYANHPVTDVDWNQANAYARWAGGRLPTEAEWEKAARGTDGRTYPWGDEQPDQSLVNCCNFVNDTMSVGSYPAGASPYGALDMAGNVLEWTADWYDSSYYSQSPGRNPTGPSSGDYRVGRGGSYYSDAAGVRVAYRYWLNPNNRYRALGFRVASSSHGF